MSLALLSNILGKRGITHKYSTVDRNFIKIYELIDGRSVPVLLVNVVDGSFLEMPHYADLTDKNKRTLADAKSEYKRRFQAWHEKNADSRQAKSVDRKNKYTVSIPKKGNRRNGNKIT